MTHRFALIALALTLAACDQSSPTPEAGVDGGPFAPDPEPESGPDPEPEPAPDPEPAPCDLTFDPLADCAMPSRPDDACVLEIDGDRRFRITLDGAGRQTSLVDGDRGGFVQAFDGEGRRTLRETLADGCVTRAVETRFDAGQVTTATRTPGGARCEIEDVADGQRVRLTVDEGCDCAGRRVAEVCEPGPSGPARCTGYRSDGAVDAVETWAYDDAGRVIEETVDEGGDGAVDRRETTRFDGQGRRVEVLLECRDCDAIGGAERQTWTYEEAPARTTHRVDNGDDGRIDFVEVTTRVGGRVVRVERGDGDGITTVVETAYDDAGGRETVTTERGAVVRTERVVVMGRRTTTTVEAAEGTTVEAVEVDDDGRLVERVIERDPGPDFRESLTWDAAGRLVAEQVVHTDADGPWSCAVQYRWTGACPAPAGRLNQPCARGGG